jgi:hypothetical protein
VFGNKRRMVGVTVGLVLSVGIVTALIWDWWRHPEAVEEPDQKRRR